MSKKQNIMDVFTERIEDGENITKEKNEEIKEKKKKITQKKKIITKEKKEETKNNDDNVVYNASTYRFKDEDLYLAYIDYLMKCKKDRAKDKTKEVVNFQSLITKLLRELLKI